MEPKEDPRNPQLEELTTEPSLESEPDTSIPDYEGQAVGGTATVNPGPTTQTPVTPPPPPFGGDSFDSSEG